MADRYMKLIGYKQVMVPIEREGCRMKVSDRELLIAISKKCDACVVKGTNTVDDCPCKKCPLYPFRTGEVKI